MPKATARVCSALLTVALLGVAGLAASTPAHGRAAAPGQGRGTGTGVAASGGDAFTEEFVGDLLKGGFEVNGGYPMLWGPDACADHLYPAMGSCYGNNPVSPYVIPVLKAWPGEQLGPTPANAFGSVRDGYTVTYRLQPRDALVFYGKMPPQGKFMALQTFEWSQPGRWEPKDYDKWAQASGRPYPMQYLFATIPPNDPKAGRTQSWSSLGDSVNNVVMQRSGDPWGQNRYIITTASATTDQAIRRVLQEQGVPAGEIFTQEIPSRDALGPIGPLGLGKNAIDFYSFFRYALPDDTTAAQQWWGSLPLTVMRVRAPASLGPVQPYGLATYGPRTARSEGYLAGDLQNLVNAVCDGVTSASDLRSADCTEPAPASSFIPDPARDYGWNAAYCRQVHMWCGDISDAGLYWTKPLPLDDGQVYAVVDTLATETGNATYVGLGVNDASTFLSPVGVTDATLRGSARGYGSTVKQADKFFVHYFTRDCSVLIRLLGKQNLDRDCTTISDQMVPLKGNTTAPGDPALKGMFWPGLRDYIEPGTAHGPDTSKLLRPRILTFTSS